MQEFQDLGYRPQQSESQIQFINNMTLLPQADTP